MYNNSNQYPLLCGEVDKMLKQIRILEKRFFNIKMFGKTIHKNFKMKI